MFQSRMLPQYSQVRSRATSLVSLCPHTGEADGCAGMGKGLGERSTSDTEAAWWEEHRRDGNWIAVLIQDCWIVPVQSSWIAV